jgi:hypothetical protein
MRYAKRLSLLAMTAIALMAFAGAASADTLTSAAGATPVLKLTSKNLTMHNAVGTASCHSAIEANVTDHGASNDVTAGITTLTFAPCVGASVHDATVIGGTLSLAVTSTNHGALRSSGANFTTTMFGMECGYSTSSTAIGTVSGGTHAELNLSATLTRTHGSFFCGSTGNVTGSYQFTSPTNVHLHDS